MTDHNQDDEIESLYKPDWVALSLAVTITAISMMRSVAGDRPVISRSIQIRFIRSGFGVELVI